MENLVNIERLSDLLSIPSVTYDEWDMVEYLSEYFDKKGYEYGVDSYGNIFVTKGTDVIKPLICAHIDTVHKKTKINIKEEWLPRLSCYGQVYPYDENVLCLKGYDDNGEETGCGGDDKCGVYVCLEILDRVDNIKLAFFVSEETGCIGSSNCEPEFFENTKFVLSYDAPGNQLVTEICNGVRIFDRESDFFKVVSKTFEEIDYKPLYGSHPYTDIYMMKKRFDIDGVNLSCGYYNMHRKSEYVCVDDVAKAIDTGLKLLTNLSNN
jgi:putative aminopeptidase FrvX